MADEFGGIEVFGRARRRREEEPQRPRARLGILALCAGVLTVVVTGVGLSSAMSGKYELGTLLAYLATGTSVVAILCGAAAVVTGRGRLWGAVAIVLGVLASPPLLTKLLGWASGLG